MELFLWNLHAHILLINWKGSSDIYFVYMIKSLLKVNLVLVGGEGMNSGDELFFIFDAILLHSIF